MRFHLGVLLALGVIIPGAATANDTAAQLATGGLIFVRNDVVWMEREDLFISLDEVRVEYEFLNRSVEDVTSLVAFPMPDVEGHHHVPLALPWADEPRDADNFLGFTVVVDGQEMVPNLEQKAIVAGLDVTADLVAHGFSPNHLAEDVEARLAELQRAVLDEWVNRGIIARESWVEEGRAVEIHWPRWILRSTYWWEMSFPAGRIVKVAHRYRPSVGGTAGTTFLEADGSPGGINLDAYRSRYCMDEGFLRAVQRATRESGLDWPPFYENWISYILLTGANWGGTIGQFRLVVDKGSERNLVSFCGENVRKIGPTTFEMTAQDFYPERDLDILIMRRTDE